MTSDGLHPTARLPAAPPANRFLFGSHNKRLIQTVLQKKRVGQKNYFLLIQKGDSPVESENRSKVIDHTPIRYMRRRA
jgi:hypothetical protein